MARILLIEDSAQVWDFIQRRLQRRGHDVVLAHDGEAGVSIAGSAHPDVILLDTSLPGMDGWAAARALKSDPSTHAIPIVGLTGAGEAPGTDSQAHWSDLHPKPIDFNRLLGQIESLLSKILPAVVTETVEDDGIDDMPLAVAAI